MKNQTKSSNCSAAKSRRMTGPWPIYGIAIFGILVLAILVLIPVPDKNKVSVKSNKTTTISSSPLPTDKAIVSVTYEWGE